MADELTQLRRMATWGLDPSNEPAARKVWAYAADEIERLTAEVERLRVSDRRARRVASVLADYVLTWLQRALDQVANEEAAALGESTPEPEVCTGVTARWCPIHGDCTCPEIGSPDDPGDRSHDSDGCPLHDMGSPHPATPEVPR